MNTQSKQLIAQFKLPSYVMGKSFADASKAINSKFEGRNDMVSNNTKNELLKRLADAQEFLKSQEQAIAQEQMALGGYVNQYKKGGEVGGDPTVDTSDASIEDDTEAVPADNTQKYIAGYNAIAPVIANAINTQSNDTQRTQMLQGINTIGGGVGSAIGGKAGGIVGNGITAATGLYEMGSEAFGKSNVDTSGQQSLKGASAGKSAGAGALKGAGTGAAIGSIIPGLGTAAGAAIGAVAGGISGYVGGKKDEKAQAKNNSLYASNINKQFSETYADGGILEDPILPMRPAEREQSMERYKLLRASAIRGSGVKSNYKPDLRSPEETRAAYDDLRASIKPGYKVNTGYIPDLRNPEETMQTYKEYRLRQQGIDPNQFAQGGGLTSADRGSDKKPYPSVASGDFAGGGRSYPIPTIADAVDALKLAGLHGRSDVKAKVYARYPSLQHAYGGDLIADKSKKNPKDILNSVGTVTPIGNTPISTAPSIANTSITLPSNINQQVYEPSTYEKIRMGLQDAGKVANKVGDKIFDNADLLRYAPAVMNAVQLAKLKKPSAVQLARLDNKYRPEYVDLAQSQNIANQELSNVNSAIQQSGASQGAFRAAMLGAQLNKTKALSAAYADAQARNAQQNAMAQQFNLGVDQTNLQQSNTQQEINDRNIGNYDTQKSQLLAQIGTDIGNIGKEQLYKQYPKMMGLGYNWNGKYFVNNKGDIKTKEEASALENIKANGGYLNSDMVSHINNMYIKRNKK